MQESWECNAPYNPANIVNNLPTIKETGKFFGNFLPAARLVNMCCRSKWKWKSVLAFCQKIQKNLNLRRKFFLKIFKKFFQKISKKFQKNSKKFQKNSKKLITNFQKNFKKLKKN